YAPTGDPQWLRSTAATFYAVGTDAIDRTTTLRTFSDQAVVPDTWDGLAATTAKAAAGALTGQAGTVQPAMDAAAAALTYLADELEGAQADHLAATALVQQGADKVNDADIEVWGVELPVPNPTKIYDGITDAVDGIEAAVAAHDRAEKAASLTVRRLGDATADARVAAAGRDGHLDPLDAVVLAHATT
nr:hypothetical protein [Micromonospora sp. DSM 115978]